MLQIFDTKQQTFKPHKMNVQMQVIANNSVLKNNCDTFLFVARIMAQLSRSNAEEYSRVNLCPYILIRGS